MRSAQLRMQLPHFQAVGDILSYTPAGASSDPERIAVSVPQCFPLQCPDRNHPPTNQTIQPPLRPSLVPRSELISQPSQRLLHILTLFSNPAGFGKPTDEMRV